MDQALQQFKANFQVLLRAPYKAIKEIPLKSWTSAQLHLNFAISSSVKDVSTPIHLPMLFQSFIKSINYNSSILKYIVSLESLKQQVFRQIETSLTSEFLVGLGNPIPIRGYKLNRGKRISLKLLFVLFYLKTPILRLNLIENRVISILRGQRPCIRISYYSRFCIFYKLKYKQLPEI